MESYSEEQLNTAFERLPVDIQEAIADAETEKKVAAIGRRHALHIDQIGLLADETGLVMLGLRHPQDFIKNLTQHLGIAPTEAETIAQEINTEVLAGLREAIKTLAEEPASTSGGTPPAPDFIARPSGGASTPNKVWEQDPYLADPTKL